ncbi:MAG: GtrA family protein [Gallionella sp.]|nr:GtrA family protein [Gallionella sp.]
MTHFQAMMRFPIIKFLGVGVLNTLFGYGLYAGLVLAHVPYLIALLMATVAGVTFNYFSFGRMVFKAEGGWWVFGKFIVAYSVVYIMNAFLLDKLTQDFGLNPYWGQLVCLPANVGVSWGLMRYWVYKKDE